MISWEDLGIGEKQRKEKYVEKMCKSYSLPGGSQTSCRCVRRPLVSIGEPCR